MAVPMVWRVFEVHAKQYSRVWRASVSSSFLNPILFLLAMGVGLGSLVDTGDGSATLGVAYLSFLAPGLLAATTMQTAGGDSAWPVMAGIKWIKTYHAALASPVSVRDLVLGHLAWIVARLFLTAGAFALVMVLFGASTISEALLAIPPAVLTGLAFGAAITAFTVRQKSEQRLTSLFRFGIVPLFLFSGTFFPIDQLPGFMQPVAFATPLWHGVELTRGAALGIATEFAWYVHVGYLAVMAAVGTRMSITGFDKRLRQ